MVALDRVISETNASIEGHNNSEKNHTSDFRETMKNVLSFITQRWKDFNQSEAQLGDELRILPEVVKDRKQRTDAKRKRKRKATSNKSKSERQKRQK